MTGTIRELDAATRDRIAAGEVVERPASAVKELVENAIDADASRIDVSVESGGIDGIRVADDGVGMDRDAVQAAVREHTTSKIAHIDDLESGIATLGFRGEALHAIGSVSRTTITTKPRADGGTVGGEVEDAVGGADGALSDGARAADADDEGTTLVVEGGEVVDVSPAGRAPGTTVAVSDLFYNVPARRKYLKQPGTEFAHVNTAVTGYALANPDVAVSLTHDGRETFATTGQGDRREAVMAVYGREVARAMIDVKAAEADLPDGPLSAVTGLMSHPETTRAGSEYCSTYVNGRYVRSSALRDAVVAAYGTQLAPDRYPFTVLFCAVDPATVDVNVHPRKLEVRFADEDGVREQVRAAVEGALLSAGLVRSSAPRGRSAPEQATIAPEGDDRDADAGSDVGASAGSDVDASAGSDADVRAKSDAESPARSPSEPTRSARTARSGTSEPSASPDASSASSAEGPDPREATDPHHRRVRGGGRQDRLAGAGEPDRDFDTLPSMRLLGQFRDTYVVAETDDGLLLIDQHAADERVNYERLQAGVGAGASIQRLTAPAEVELTAREAAALDERVDVFERLGFRADRTDERLVSVTAVPATLADADAASLVQDVCAALAESEADADATVEEAIDAVLADLACYPSVTGNTSLTEGSIRGLLAALDDCTNPYACPHGRPVLIALDAEDLEARFERDYPGHGGRRDDG